MIARQTFQKRNKRFLTLTGRKIQFPACNARTRSRRDRKTFPEKLNDCPVGKIGTRRYQLGAPLRDPAGMRFDKPLDLRYMRSSRRTHDHVSVCVDC